MGNNNRKKLFADNEKLAALVEKVMAHPMPIRRYSAEDYDAEGIAKILSILQKRVDWATAEHPGENLESVLGKDVVDQYATFSELASMRGISISTEADAE